MFRVSNAGGIEHEFRLSNQHRVDEHIAASHEDHAARAAAPDDEEHADVIALVAAGDIAEITMTFSDDQTLYTMVACLIPGDYEAGMVASLQNETS